MDGGLPDKTSGVLNWCKSSSRLGVLVGGKFVSQSVTTTLLAGSKGRTEARMEAASSILGEPKLRVVAVCAARGLSVHFIAPRSPA